MLGVGIYAQCPDANGGILLADDTLKCVGETTTLTLIGSQGTINWLERDKGASSWILNGSFGTQISVNPAVNKEYVAVALGASLCQDTSNIISIYVSDFGETPNPGFGGDICGISIPLSATPTGQPVHYWSVVSGSGNAIFYQDSSYSSPDSIVVDSYGTYEFAWNIGDGVCTKDSAITLNALEIPIAYAGVDTNYCGRSFNLSAELSVSGATGQWFKESGGIFNFTDKFDPTTEVNANPDAFQIKWRESNGTCEDEMTIDVNVADMPSANAGDDDVTCSDSYTLAAVPSFGFGDWRFISGPDSAIFDNSNISNTQVTAESYGTNYHLEWSETNSYCVSRDTVQIDFFEQPIADAGNSAEVCGDTALINAIASVGTGVWLAYTGPIVPAFGDDSIDSTWIYNNGQYGNYQIIWQETNSICIDSDTIDVSFFEQPIAYAGNNDSICGNQAIMNAVASVGDGVWTSTSSAGTANFAFPDADDSPVNVSDFGIYTFTWKETNAICSDSANIYYGFFEQPTANAGLGGDTCGLRFPLEAIPSVTGSTGNWYKFSGTGTASFAPENSNVSVAEVDNSGMYGFSWIERNVICIDTSLAVQVEYLEVPIADPGDGGDVCALSQQLEAVDYGVPGIWTSPGMVFTPNNTTPDALATVADTGLFKANWMVDNGTCSADSTITLHFRYRPQVIVNQTDDVCGETARLSATTDIGSGIWTALSSNENITFQNPTAEETDVTIENYGQYQFMWKANNGECADSASTQFVFYEIPIVDCGNDSSICGTEIRLVATVNTGTGEWMQIRGSGTSSFIPDNSNTDVDVQVTSPGTYSYTRVQNNAHCAAIDTVLVEYFKQPVASIDTIFPLYNLFETPLLAQSIESTESGLWTVLNEGTGNVDDITSDETEIRDLSFGENVVMWQVTNEVCYDDDTTTIMVYDIFIPEILTPNGDGSNDVFEILGLEDVRQAELFVYNRWGAEVYSNENYQEDNNWGGTNKSGELLSNDTYFHVVRIDGSRAIKGFVVIKN